jgi:hypothetical protein
MGGLSPNSQRLFVEVYDLTQRVITNIMQSIAMH